MKVCRVLIVFLGIVMTVEGFLDNIACVAHTAGCAVQLATATTGQTCSDKRPYFQCLATNGCKASTDFYKSQVTAFNYTGCGAAELLAPLSLLVAMLVALRLVSN